MGKKKAKVTKQIIYLGWLKKKKKEKEKKNIFEEWTVSEADSRIARIEYSSSNDIKELSLFLSKYD